MSDSWAGEAVAHKLYEHLRGTERLQKVRALEIYYLDNLVEDPIDGSNLDCLVLDALESVKAKIREIHGL